ncbi:MAG: hypothetical protein LBU70_00685 [Chitinispirillales bacterium]|jgi:hypothetical protein|nr:hypothetical protein [Chitinispirillales bacterium]
MEAIRQVIDSDSLRGIVSLPSFFQNKKVEIIVFLKEEKVELPPLLSKHDIDALLKDSITESLIGVLPHSNRTLEDYRTERLNKYECVN